MAIFRGFIEHLAAHESDYLCHCVSPLFTNLQCILVNEIFSKILL